ncbi:MAG: recombinase family protein [Rubrobacteraceae bacterium]
MKVGYIRSSKKDLNPDIQRGDLVAAVCERLFEEQISSRKEDRSEHGAALEYVRDGEALVVWKRDRFGKCPKRGRRLYPKSAKRWAYRGRCYTLTWSTTARRGVESRGEIKTRKVR